MFEGLDDDRKLLSARKLFEDTIDIWRPWFKEMQTDFKFHAGGDRQWPEEDLAILRAEKRPPLTFNLMKVIIRELIGAQEDAKREAVAVPVGREDGMRSEVTNIWWRAVRRQTDAEFAEGEAFEKGAIGGVGFAVVDVNPKQGRPDWVDFVLAPIHPFECMVDPASQRRDMRDAQFIFWHRWMRDSEFVRAYPEKADLVKDIWEDVRSEGVGLHEVPSNSREGGGVPGPTSPLDLPGTDVDLLYLDRRKRLIRVLHLEYRCPTRAYYARDPSSGELQPVSKRNYDLFKNRMPELEFTSVWEDEVRWLEFIGQPDGILFDDVAPVNPKCFSIETFTADRDHLTGEPVGILRDLRDPQLEINKRHSQLLNNMNQGGAPGVYAEENAVVDATDFERAQKTPGATAWLKAGGLGKIQERKAPDISPAASDLYEKAVRMFMRIGGVDVDTLTAQRSADEPATTALLRYRKSILAVTKLMQNYYAFKKRLLQNAIYVLATAVPDDQLERMLGDTRRWRVQNRTVVDLKSGEQLTVDSLLESEWDIEMDVAAANTTISLLTLQILIQMVTVGVPIDPAVMVDALPVSQDKKNRMLDFIDAANASAAQEKAVNQKELTDRLSLDAAIAKTEAALKVANTAEDGRHARELEMLQALKGQRDFMVDLFKIAQDQKNGGTQTVIQVLTKLLDFAQTQQDQAEAHEGTGPTPPARPAAPPMPMGPMMGGPQPGGFPDVGGPPPSAAAPPGL